MRIAAVELDFDVNGASVELSAVVGRGFFDFQNVVVCHFLKHLSPEIRGKTRINDCFVPNYNNLQAANALGIARLILTDFFIFANKIFCA